MPKRSVSIRRVNRLVNHGPTVLVSCAHGGVSNIITLAWTTPVSIRPPMLAIAIAPERYSHQLIAASREFTVNIPSARMLQAVWYCGTTSGRDGDKFEGASLTPLKSRTVRAPGVAECMAHIECRVVRAVTAGDHTVFVGEVVAASAERSAFDGRLVLAGAHHTLHHLGGSSFISSSGRKLEAT